MQETIASQPGELRRLLGDDAAIGPAAERLRGRRVLLVGTGTSWHAAGIGAWFLRAAGVEAWAVQAMDAALSGPRPGADDGLILLSHRGTKRYTTDVVEQARAAGAAIVSISARGVAGADIETVEPERSSAFTASHLGALMRVAQLAVALGGDLGGPLASVPDAVTGIVDGPPIGVEPPARSLEFIGAGPNRWTAAEGALKIRETAYVAASGLAVEQYLHGPSVAVGPGDTLVALNGGGPGEERLLAVARGAESCGVAVRLIEAKRDGELLSVFPLTAAVQRIALEAAEALGTNPDSFGRDVPARAHALDGIDL
ncbi:MAG TPA: SIS domain-containing protein [Gaiellales bacterium]|nr:SIS domain-containing protein [Gaiellales bacterium]